MRLLILFLLFASIFSASAEEPAFVAKYRPQVVEKWEHDILAFEARDQSEQHPADSILFTGSSSIRLWKNIVADMSPYHPIQRGFGGSRFSDLAIYADRIITPHQFQAVCIFVANDISGKENDKTPEEVAKLFQYVHGKIKAHNPSAPIFYIAVTPTEARAAVWQKAKAANTAIREICANTPDTYFIGTESIFLDQYGNPRSEFFIDDKLHLNETGYHLWAAAIKSHLDTVLNGAK